jgi:hypothetical protein
MNKYALSDYCLKGGNMSNREKLKTVSIRAGFTSAIVLILTAIHHAYGAVVYNTPWRLHVVPPAIITTIAIATFLYLTNRCFETFLGQASFYLAISLIVLVPIGFFGGFEGAYNHVLKNIFYFSGAGESVMQKLFPPPMYELPNNLFFETTGVLTFFAALVAGYFAYDLYKRWQQIHRKNLQEA